MSTACILDIHTAVPEHAYSQEFALEFLSSLPVFGEKERQFLQRLYRGTGIERRHTVIGDYGKDPADFRFFPPSADLRPEPGLQQRNDLYITEAKRLSARAAAGLMEGLDSVEPGSITHLITVSCTGFSAPGFDFHVVRELGLRQGVQRYHLGFMGCYAAVPALRLAEGICRAQPGSRVLIVALELCSVHFQQSVDRESMVAHSLFADGAAACLVAARPKAFTRPVLELKGFLCRILEGSEQDMAWTIGRSAFDMKLSASVPREIQKAIAVVVRELGAQVGIDGSGFDLWAIHPGGRAILDRVAGALELPRESLWASYEVLRRYGNMSSATILFVLELLLRDRAQGTIFAAAFGPGLTLESACLEKR